MRFLIAILTAGLLGGCASHFNRPPQPEGNYWQINKPQHSAEPAKPAADQAGEGKDNG